jgi:hypothetical protein
MNTDSSPEELARNCFDDVKSRPEADPVRKLSNSISSNEMGKSTETPKFIKPEITQLPNFPISDNHPRSVFAQGKRMTLDSIENVPGPDDFMSVISKTQNNDTVLFTDQSPMNFHRIQASDVDSRANLMSAGSQRSNGFGMFRADTLDDVPTLETPKISPVTILRDVILEVEDLDLSPKNQATPKKIDFNLQVKMLEHFEKVPDSSRLERVLSDRTAGCNILKI